MKDQDTKNQKTQIGQILLLFLMLLGFSVHQSEAQEISEVKAYVKANGIQATDPFMDLLYGSDGIIEIDGDRIILPKNPRPKNAVIKSSNLKHLPSQEGQFGAVQFLQINMAEGERFSLTPDQLVGFPGLRYMLIISGTPLNEVQISQMLPGFADSGLVILYQISRPG